MKIPKKLKILGHEYVVLQKQMALQGRTVGTHCTNVLEMTIEVDMAESNKAEVLLHEIIEGIRARLDIELTHQDLTRLSEGVFQVIRDNNLDFRKPK